MEIITKNKNYILPELIIWAETFNSENIVYYKNNIEEDEEKEITKSYEFMLNLVGKLENDKCTQKDYEDILFNIEQINYNSIKIVL